MDHELSKALEQERQGCYESCAEKLGTNYAIDFLDEAFTVKVFSDVALIIVRSSDLGISFFDLK